MKRLLLAAILALTASLLVIPQAAPSAGESEAISEDYEVFQEEGIEEEGIQGDDMCACWDPPPPPPPPQPPPAPPPPPPPAPPPAPPPPPNGDPWAPEIAPGEGVGNWHPNPGGGWQLYGSNCYSKELKRSTGSGPWGRRLFLYTVWCGKSGRITYRKSSHRTDHDTFCSNENPPTHSKTYGGANFPLVELQAWAEVRCASIPTNWPNYHDTLMMRVQYFPNGAYKTVAWG
jgi:hypothetical protein